ncbi:carbohydrate kinase family protein [Paramaledivibacter caminithermalis]|jgi:sugar/nucleoside kinase (ribokinase family)|uniref:Sugar or nucleoside kinase, ribokinase family n=1 Tax=Paramaledivibacter caminithermalis (strain DSM 15212 / CIP 107654 / DViRD3) TaxID=1121301 RepID=A0A1M6SPE7_PARC5|nr:carbohydrate kinase family protein [Paramaledivibacter caminithermalis]SHK46519.1 Sugar or nucleoside kinase, ribokinase family [Paramaledivibacter caminithermalis DSM 15212]
MSSIVCVGASVLDISTKIGRRLPERGSLIFTDTVEISFGGCALNVASNLSRLGVRSKLITKVGNDMFGDSIVNRCKELDIELQRTDRSELRTSLSQILLDETGDRRIIHNIGANKSFSKDDIDLDMISQYEYVYFGGVLGMPLIDEQLEYLFSELKTRNKEIKIILDVIYSENVYSLNEVKRALKYVDYFVPNYSEARSLSSKTSLNSITEDLLELGVKNLIITLGEDGVCYRNHSLFGFHKAVATKVQDTTGAGDAFVAGLIYGLLHDQDFESSIVKGLEVASECVAKMTA